MGYGMLAGTRLIDIRNSFPHGKARHCCLRWGKLRSHSLGEEARSGSVQLRYGGFRRHNISLMQSHRD